MEGLQLAGNVLIALGALAAWLFVLMYRRLDWKANAIGKFLMRFILLIAIILTWAVTFNFFNLSQEWIVAIRFFIYLSVFVELVLLNSLLLHYEKKARTGEVHRHEVQTEEADLHD